MEKVRCSKIFQVQCPNCGDFYEFDELDFWECGFNPKHYICEQKCDTCNTEFKPYITDKD